MDIIDYSIVLNIFIQFRSSLLSMRVKHTGNYAKRVDFYRLEYQNNICRGTFVYGKWSALSMKLNSMNPVVCERSTQVLLNQKLACVTMVAFGVCYQ